MTYEEQVTICKVLARNCVRDQAVVNALMNEIPMQPTWREVYAQQPQITEKEQQRWRESIERMLTK